MPIVVLAEALDPDSHILHIQDYAVGGETVIPVFSSKESITASTQGSDLGKPLIQIKRELLAQLSKGFEVYLLDPQTDRELRFTAADLKAAFPDADA